jgi:hypothetical protein
VVELRHRWVWLADRVEADVGEPWALGGHLSVRVYECTSVRVYECMSVRVYECTSVRVYECTSECMSVRVGVVV